MYVKIIEHHDGQNCMMRTTFDIFSVVQRYAQKWRKKRQRGKEKEREREEAIAILIRVGMCITIAVTATVIDNILHLFQLLP